MLEGLRRRSFRLLRRVPPPLLERAVRLGSPSYTLGTACLIEHDDKVLLVQASYRRNWSLPGGLLDHGEEPAHGLLREVREEVGLDVEVAGQPVVVVDVGSQLVEFFFRARLAPRVGPDQARVSSAEIEAVEWVTREEAATMVRGAPRLSEKLSLFDELPDGGLVVFERFRRRR